jgi:glycerol 2-dehydrogenase (NADP+)
MHWPIPLPPLRENIPLLPNGNRQLLDEHEWSYIDTWKAMENLVKQGKCKAIGVCNMSIPYLERLITECEIIPAVNQVIYITNMLMPGGISSPTTSGRIVQLL